MSEFKAQIFGIIIVISLFVLISGKVTGLFDDMWTAIENNTNTKISSILG